MIYVMVFRLAISMCSARVKGLRYILTIDLDG